MRSRPYLLLYMANSCLEHGTTSKVQLQVSHWEELHAMFQRLVQPSGGENNPSPPPTGGGKGGVAHSKVDTLLEFRQLLGLQPGASGGLATVGVAGAPAPRV